MRKFLIAASAAALISACGQAGQQQAEAPPEAPPTVQACNSVQPDMARLVRVDEALAAAAVASDLRGGAITPGTYDLTRAVRVGQPTGWQGERAVALSITEELNGPLTLNWSGNPPGGDADTWTASFTDVAQQGQLTFTCGRIGEVLAGFAATANTLQLRIPDGANGSLQLDFQRRS